MANLLAELKKRKIYQAVVIYAVVAWVLIQIADVVLPTFGAPEWVNQTLIFLVILGFPAVMILVFALGPVGGNSAEVDAASPETELNETPGQNESPHVDKGNKPSIAVLPFDNLSNDQEKEFLADGMTEDIITGLSFNPHLSVVSRNATMVYKKNPADLRDVGKTLGVRYLLEGSIRPVGERVRITAQLIEASSGSHLWAEKYDRPIAEIFDVQDDVIAEIIGALDAQIFTAEFKRASTRSTDNLDAWGLLQKSSALTAGFTPNKKKFDESTDLLRAAIEKDPNYAIAHAALAFNLRGRVLNGYDSNVTGAFEESSEHARIALAIAPDDPVNLRWIGCAFTYGPEIEKGIHYLRRSLEKNPNDGITLMHLALALGNTDNFEESYNLFEHVRRVAPSGGLSIGYRWYESMVLAHEGRYVESESMINEFLLRVPDYPGARMFLGMVQARQGRLEEATQTIREAMASAPDVNFSEPPLFLRSHRAPQDELLTPELLKKIWPSD